MRSAEVIEGGFDIGDGCCAHRTSGRHARGIHDPLRERLRTLELSGGPAGAEHRDASFTQHVGDTRDQRCFGADDDEVDAVLVRVSRDRGAVELVEVDQGGVLSDAGVAGRGEDLVIGLFGPQGEDDRVLARARAEDEDLHAAQPTGAPRQRSDDDGPLGGSVPRL